MKRFLTFSLIFLILTISVKSEIINVPGDYATIQAGINAANAGDTVLVQNGTYNENINFNGKSITLASLYINNEDETDILNTIIDGGGNSNCVRFATGETATSVIIGFTVQNGYTDYYGGGIYCYGASPTIKNMIVSDCTGQYGGGIGCVDNASPICTDIVVDGNTGLESGGGIYCHQNSHAEFTNLIVKNNIGKHGCGVFTSYCVPKFVNALFYSNSTNYDSGTGGAVRVFNYSQPKFYNCTFANNSAVYGAAFYCDDFQCMPELVNCILWGNIAEQYDTEIWALSDIYPPSVSYCNIDEGTGETWFDDNTCIDTNPLFINSGIGDYSIPLSSPCVDVGIPDVSALELPDYDLSGNLRIFNNIIDLGAYECQTEGANNSPTDIILSEDSINEGLEEGTIVGEFSTIDIDEDDSFTYSLIEGNGSNDADNDNFYIDDNKLRTNIVLNFDVQDTHNIYIQTNDNNGGTFEKAFIINVNDVTAIKNDIQSGFSIYPNPTKGFFNLDASAIILNVTLTDVTGRLIYSFDFSDLQYKNKIDISNQPKGIYFFIVETKNQIHIEKLIKN